MAENFTNFIVTYSPIITCLAGLVGGLVGGGCSLLGAIIATNRNHRNQLERDKTLAKEKVRAVLEAILEEIQILRDRYMQNVGGTVDKIDGTEPFYTYYPISSNYFAIFDHNTEVLGDINNRELRLKIISTYIDAKSLVDTFKHNNVRIKELKDCEIKLRQCSGVHAVNQMERDHLKINLSQYAKTIKDSHEKLIKEADVLISMIHSAIEENNY